MPYVETDRGGGAPRRVMPAASGPAAGPAKPTVLHAVDVALDWAVRGGGSVGVLMLHLCRLDAPGPQPHHHRIANALLKEAADPGGGQVLTCSNGDLVMLADPLTSAALVPTLSRLFNAEAPGPERLLSLWTLPADEADVRAGVAEACAAPAPLQHTSAAMGVVAALEAMLASATLDGLGRRQLALRIAGGRVENLFQELTLDAALWDTPASAPAADPFLLRHFAGRVDERLLRTPLPPVLLRGPALHLNLTLEGIASPAFAAIGRAGLGIELQAIEAVSDLPRFAAAAAAVRAAGCRLVLDGVDHAAFLLLSPAGWDVDLLKLDWSPRLAALPPDESQQLRQRIAGFGADRIVLNRTETEAAIAWGLRSGITQFQGRTIDAMLASGRLGRCAHAAGCTLAQCLGRAAATAAAGRFGCNDLALLDAGYHRQQAHV